VHAGFHADFRRGIPSVEWGADLLGRQADPAVERSR